MPLQESQHNSVDMHSALVQYRVSWPSLTAYRHTQHNHSQLTNCHLGYNTKLDLVWRWYRTP